MNKFKVGDRVRTYHSSFAGCVVIKTDFISEVNGDIIQTAQGYYH